MSQNTIPKLTMLDFAEDITRLIIRYTRPSPTDDLSKAVTPLLTHEDVVFTIQHVLYALSIQGFGDNNNSKMLETTKSASAANIPETLNVDMKHESDSEDTHRSLDVHSVQSVFTDDDASVSGISKASKEEQENSVNTLQNDKKFISQSNPAICINNISRSDTFVREESQQINEDQEDVFEDFTNETDDLSSYQALLSEIKTSVVDIMAKLKNLEQLPPLIRLSKVTAKVQQSPVPTGHSSPHRTSTMNKTKVLTNSRRSCSVFPKIPTSPKLLATESGNIERRKSTGGIGTKEVSAGKSGEYHRAGYAVIQSGLSNLTLSERNKISPGLSEFQPKFTKNPKYAHVQSTIPKAIQKKKMQDDKTIKMKLSK